MRPYNDCLGRFLGPCAPAVLAVLLAMVLPAAEPLRSTPGLKEQMLQELGPQSIIYVERPLARTFGDSHWYNNHPAPIRDRRVFSATCSLVRLDLASGNKKVILQYPDAWIRDPTVHYDGSTLLVSLARPEATTYPGEYRLFRLKADGSGLTQITGDTGLHSDFEACWMPDDRIVFCSTRTQRIVPCLSGRVAILHRCNADGSDIRCLSANLENENSPTMLPDGRVLFMRWEYVDRPETKYHHLWTIYPDGTVVSVYYGNQFDAGVYLDAQAVPGTGEVVFVDAPGHGITGDHYGTIRLLAASPDPDDRRAAVRLGAAGGHSKDPKDQEPWGCDPCVLSKDWFLFAKDDGLWLMNRDGRAECIHRLDAAAQDRIQFRTEMSKSNKRPLMGLHEPRLLKPRPREPVIPERVNWSASTGRLYLSDVRMGRNMAGVQAGEITRMLVLEIPPKPGVSDISCGTSGYTSRGLGGRFNKRVVGEFPVEADGSAFVSVPARRALQLIALDARGHAVKRMNSFLSVMPGETVGCLGCHEQRTQTRTPVQGLASRRPPSVLGPIAGVPDFIDYPVHIQPILDRHCIQCHDSRTMAGKIDLTGQHGGFRSFSYLSLTQERFMPYIWKDFIEKNNYASNLSPHSYGSSAWKALPHFEGQAKGHEKIRLDPGELRLVQIWADLPAQYRGTYFQSQNDGHIHTLEFNAKDSPMQTHCASCHWKKPDGFVFPSFKWTPGWTPARITNFCVPEQSIVLRAPLAKEAGGLGWCRTADGSPVFADTKAAGYQQLLAFIRKRAGTTPTLPGFGGPGRDGDYRGHLEGNFGLHAPKNPPLVGLPLFEWYLQQAYPEAREPSAPPITPNPKP